MPIAKVNGIELYYEESGRGEPLVLIGGYTADHTSWAHLVPVFSKKYHTIVVDNRGVGQTVFPDGPFTIEDMAKDVAGLLDMLGIEKAHIAGVSMGGRIAQAIVLNHPGKVKSLVLCSTAARADDRSKFALRLLADEYAKGKISYEFHMLMLQSWTLSERLLANPEILKTRFAQAASLRTKPTPENMVRQLQSGYDFDTRARLGDIKVPTLVIHGSNDILFPIRCGKELASGIPGAKLFTLEGGAHSVYMEMADKIMPEIMGFLAGVDAKGR